MKWKGVKRARFYFVGLTTASTSNVNKLDISNFHLLITVISTSYSHSPLEHVQNFRK
jgi:hypothetical protein